MDEPRLTIEAVYDDEHLVELEVVAWNGRFGGRTSVYVGTDELQEFARALAGFPPCQ
jgi:hypothetical protein